MRIKEQETCLTLQEHDDNDLIFCIFRIIPIAHKIRRPCGKSRSARTGDINVSHFYGCPDRIKNLSFVTV